VTPGDVERLAGRPPRSLANTLRDASLWSPQMSDWARAVRLNEGESPRPMRRLPGVGARRSQSGLRPLCARSGEHEAEKRQAEHQTRKWEPHSGSHARPSGLPQRPVARLGAGSRLLDCHDNAVVETFFETLKAELVRGRMYPSRVVATAAIQTAAFAAESECPLCRGEDQRALLHGAQVMPCVLATPDPDVGSLPTNAVDAAELRDVDPSLGGLPTTLPLEDEFPPLRQCIRPFPHPERVSGMSVVNRRLPSEISPVRSVRHVSNFCRCFACKRTLRTLPLIRSVLNLKSWLGEPAVVSSAFNSESAAERAAARGDPPGA
jgi:hypothetical protein